MKTPCLAVPCFRKAGVLQRVQSVLLATLMLTAGVAAARSHPPAGQATWTPVARLPFPNHDMAYAVRGDRPYLAGGMAFVGEREEHRYYADLLSYDRRRDRWEALAPMSRARALAGMAELDGKLWVTGGRTGDAPETVTDTAEAYDPRHNAWQALPAMRSPRTEPGVAALRGRIYAVGGGGRQGQSLASVESFAPGGKSWRDEPPLPAARRGLAAAEAHNRLWVVGGGKDLYSYDAKERRWTIHAPMSAVRFSPAVAWYRDRLWVLGGNGSDDQLATSEIFDPKTGHWSAGPTLPQKMGWFGAFVARDQLQIAGGLYFDKERQKYVFLYGAFVLDDR